MNKEIQHKDARIQTIVEYLQDKYGAENFKIRDYWDGDDAVVGLMDNSEKFMVYISTFGLEDSHYFVELENLIKDNEMPYVPVGEFENIDLAELEKIFVQHLRINQ